MENFQERRSRFLIYNDDRLRLVKEILHFPSNMSKEELLDRLASLTLDDISGKDLKRLAIILGIKGTYVLEKILLAEKPIPYESYNLSELRAFCKQLGLANCSQTKAKILEMLKEPEKYKKGKGRVQGKKLNYTKNINL